MHGNDAGGGFENGWVEMLELNRFVAVAGMEEKMNRAVESIVRGKTTVFSGNYIGVNPLDPTDTIDLNQGFEENRDASYPSFAYILQDYITVEN